MLSQDRKDGEPLGFIPPFSLFRRYRELGKPSYQEAA